MQKEGSRVLEQNNLTQKNFFDEYASAVEVMESSRETDFTYVAKRTIDIIVSLFSLPFALIIIILFSIVIKLESPGPAIFTQVRVGQHGKYFKVYKLRSMTVDAEKNGAVWAQQNDPRVTKVGKLIRKTRIDELPQLINILKGDMSLVGPRPERPMFTAEFEKEIPGFTRRLLVKPGLTGWAQVNGGYEITPEEKLKLDLYYIDNLSLSLDFKIILKTIKVVITGDGAR